MNNSNVIKFEPNTPVEVRLKYPEGLNVQGQYGPRVLFTLEDGRRMYLDPAVAFSIRQLGFQPGQPFTIVKWVNGKRTRWDVNPATTRAEEIAPALERSIQQAQMRKPPQSERPQPTMTRGTGTHGPAPQPQMRPQPRIAPATPQRVPMNVAFGEIVAFVDAELKARGEQWSDQARQAAVCTLFIQAGHSNLLTLWERPAK